MSKVNISRRQFLKGASLGISAAVLAACAPVAAPGATSSNETSDAAGTDPVSITFWSSYSGNNGEAETELVQRFNDMQEEVILQYEFQGNYEATATKVTAALQADTAPNFSLLSDVWWFKFYINQALLPLDDLFATEGVNLDDYQDSLIEEGVRQGQHYWVPFARSTPLFYYNKEKWEAAGLPDRGPETWDEFETWAPALLEKEGDEVKVSAFAHPDSASYIAWLFQGVAWQFGGQYSDPDFTMTMTAPETVEAGQFYFDTVHTKGYAVPSKDISTDFINGFTAAAMMSTGSMGGIKANAEFEFGTAFLPKQEFFGCCTGGAGLSILNTASAEEQAAAMKYIAFASNPESTTFWAQRTGYMPVRKSVLDNENMQAYFEEFPQFQTAVEQLSLTRAQDAARVWVPNGDQIIGKGLERVTVLGEDAVTVFADVQATLEQEAAPVVEALQAIEG